MIETDKLVEELLSVIGYAQQTLKLHPEKVDVIQEYLASERVRLREVIRERQLDENLDILGRIVVY